MRKNLALSFLIALHLLVPARNRSLNANPPAGGAAQVLGAAAAADRLADTITVGGVKFFPAKPPRGLLLREHLGLVAAAAVDGQLVYRAKPGADLFETRAGRGITGENPFPSRGDRVKEKKIPDIFSGEGSR